MGASFIGLEVAASLRARNLEVHVVAPEKAAAGARARPAWGIRRALHEAHGVIFHLGDARRRSTRASCSTSGGDARGGPRGRRRRRAAAARLAEEAGLAIDRGVTVDETGDERTRHLRRGRHRPLARSAHAAAIRVEHWVVAERQGQTAARNMLGPREVRRFRFSGANTMTSPSTT